MAPVKSLMAFKKHGGTKTQDINNVTKAYVCGYNVDTLKNNTKSNKD